MKYLLLAFALFVSACAHKTSDPFEQPVSEIAPKIGLPHDLKIVSVQGLWQFIGFAHPAYYNNQGYSGSILIYRNRVTIRLNRIAGFADRSMMTHILPPDELAVDVLEYKLKLKASEDGPPVIEGAPFDGMPMIALHFDGYDQLCIGAFDPPLYFERQRK